MVPSYDSNNPHQYGVGTTVAFYSNTVVVTHKAMGPEFYTYSIPFAGITSPLEFTIMGKVILRMENVTVEENHAFGVDEDGAPKLYDYGHCISVGTGTYVELKDTVLGGSIATEQHATLKIHGSEIRTHLNLSARHATVNIEDSTFVSTDEDVSPTNRPTIFVGGFISGPTDIIGAIVQGKMDEDSTCIEASVGRNVVIAAGSYIEAAIPDQAEVLHWDEQFTRAIESM